MPSESIGSPPPPPPLPTLGESAHAAALAAQLAFIQLAHLLADNGTIKKEQLTGSIRDLAERLKGTDTVRRLMLDDLEWIVSALELNDDERS